MSELGGPYKRGVDGGLACHLGHHQANGSFSSAMNGCRYRGVSYLQRVPGARTSSEKNVSILHYGESLKAGALC